VYAYMARKTISLGLCSLEMFPDFLELFFVPSHNRVAGLANHDPIVIESGNVTNVLLREGPVEATQRTHPQSLAGALHLPHSNADR